MYSFHTNFYLRSDTFRRGSTVGRSQYRYMLQISTRYNINKIKTLKLLKKYKMMIHLEGNHLLMGRVLKCKIKFALEQSMKAQMGS